MRGWWHQLVLVSLVISDCLVATLPSLAERCDLAEIKSARNVHDTLSRRAVEAVERASRVGYQSDIRLAELLEPSAIFDLGAGDVGRPLGKGIDGLGSLAVAMHADSYRFDGWNYMDLQTDGCATQKVSVDFVDNSGETSSIVEFTFQEGRIVSAIGWERFIESGPLNPLKGRKPN